jgi:hypothetical protein
MTLLSLVRRELSVWLNNADVRKALHAAPVSQLGVFQV